MHIETGLNIERDKNLQARGGIISKHGTHSLVPVDCVHSEFGGEETSNLKKKIISKYI